MAALVRNFSNTLISFETPVRNYRSQSYREETLNGRSYVVCPMTMIVPGVLSC